MPSQARRLRRWRMICPADFSSGFPRRRGDAVDRLVRHGIARRSAGSPSRTSAALSAPAPPPLEARSLASRSLPGHTAITSSALSRSAPSKSAPRSRPSSASMRLVRHAVQHPRRPAERRRRDAQRADGVAGVVLAVAEGALAVLPGLAPVDRRQAHQKRLRRQTAAAIARSSASRAVGAPLERVLARRVMEEARRLARAPRSRRSARSPRSDAGCRSTDSRAAPSACRPPASTPRARARIRAGAKASAGPPARSPPRPRAYRLSYAGKRGSSSGASSGSRVSGAPSKRRNGSGWFAQSSSPGPGAKRLKRCLLRS